MTKEIEKGKINGEEPNTMGTCPRSSAGGRYPGTGGFIRGPA